MLERRRKSMVGLSSGRDLVTVSATFNVVVLPAGPREICVHVSLQGQIHIGGGPGQADRVGPRAQILRGASSTDEYVILYNLDEETTETPHGYIAFLVAQVVRYRRPTMWA